MKLQDQVCTLEQAKKLKELGVDQSSLFSWCGDETNRLMDGGASGIEYGKWVFVNTTKPANNQEEDHRDLVPSAKPFAAAFTVAELGVMLPAGYCSGNGIVSGKTKWCAKAKSNVWFDDTITETVEGTEAQARAEMLMYLLGNKIITSEEVNSRLNINH